MKSVKGYKHQVDNKMPYYGETDVNKKVIKINKKKAKASNKKHGIQQGELIDSIVHEHTHARHPKMHERTVQKVTRAILPTLSKKQKQKYYAKYT